MRWFRPRYRIEVEGRAGTFQFYVWHGWDIVASGHGFPTAVEAARRAGLARKDLLEAWEINR